MRYFPLQASLAKTASYSLPDVVIEDPNAVGYAQVTVDVTAFGGTAPTLQTIIEGLDPISGKYYTLLASAAVAGAVGTLIYRVGPGLTAAANLVANDFVPKHFRVRFVIGGTTPSLTFTVGVNVS